MSADLCASIDAGNASEDDNDAPWNTMNGLRAIITAAPPAPTKRTDETLSHISHRVDGVAAVKKSPDFKRALAFLGAANMPPEPNPYFVRAYSKRQWESVMVDWRHALARVVAVAIHYEGSRKNFSTLLFDNFERL